MLTRQLWILWPAMLASLVIYGVMPLLLPAVEGYTPVVDPLEVGVLSAVALAIGIGSLVIRRFALIRPLASGALELGSKAGQARLFVVSILCWALSEAIGLFGLVLFLVHQSPLHLYPFLAGAIALMLVHMPRTAALRRLASSADLARPDLKIG